MYSTPFKFVPCVMYMQEMASVRAVKGTQKSATKSVTKMDVFASQSPCSKRSPNSWEDDASLESNSLDSCGSYSQRPVAVVNPFHSQDQEVNCFL